MHDCMIRKMNEIDMVSVAELYRRMYGEQKSLGMLYSLREEELEPLLAAQLKSKLHFLYVLDYDDVIKGFVSASLVKLQKKYRLEEEDFIGFINDLYIEPDLRGSGYAEKLLSVVESEFRTVGVRYIELHVVQGNAQGIRFWSRNGFEEMMQVMHKRIKEE